jgi:malate dehydrogenase (oxaloacetate-decarboxylating)
MFDVTVHCNPTTGERYTSINLRGYQLLEQPFFNKGTAFSQEERAELKLEELLPPAVATIDAQLNRAYSEFNNKNTPLEKHIYLNSLHDRNETLFFRLLQTHITEMLPLVYTPVVGEAIMKYSHIYRRPRGLYITYPEIDRIDEILAQRQFENVELICVTDGERILEGV